jgi:hypothetical protein
MSREQGVWGTESLHFGRNIALPSIATLIPVLRAPCSLLHKKKDPVGAASAANRVLRFGEDGRGSGTASSGFATDGGNHRAQRLLMVRRAEPDKRLSQVAPVPTQRPERPDAGCPLRAPSLPGNVKRAVSRDGHGRHTAATVCLDSQTDKFSTSQRAAGWRRPSSNAVGVPIWQEASPRQNFGSSARRPNCHGIRVCKSDFEFFQGRR